MSTLTPNYGLIVPEGTDTVEQVRADYATNLNTIDGIGGGGSGGHTIVNPSGSDMPAEGKLQFTGGVTVTDDSVNGKTVVDISGGGGNVYGAFIDTDRVLATYNSSGGSAIPSYTALEDCFVAFYVFGKNSQTCRIYVDSVEILTIYFQGDGVQSPTLYLKKGQTLSFSSFDYWSFHYEIYGLTQGANGIFTPIIYSDTERVVGVWRDNKPLYAKTVGIGSLPNNATKLTAHGISDIDTICSIDGIAYDGSGKTIPLGYINVDSYTYDVQVEVGKVNVEIKTKIDFSPYTGYITVQYTKTTDVAGSGNWNTDGVPTVHYSTSEQVIGTWIDGKPLYGKTVIFGSIPSNATKEVDHNINDLKMTIGFEGTMMSGTICETLPSGENSNFRIQTTPTKLKIITGTSWSGWDDSYITIKYTKTTD